MSLWDGVILIDIFFFVVDKMFLNQICTQGCTVSCMRDDLVGADTRCTSVRISVQIPRTHIKAGCIARQSAIFAHLWGMGNREKNPWELLGWVAWNMHWKSRDTLSRRVEGGGENWPPELSSCPHMVACSSEFIHIVF